MSTLANRRLENQAKTVLAGEVMVESKLHETLVTIGKLLKVYLLLLGFLFLSKLYLTDLKLIKKLILAPATGSNQIASVELTVLSKYLSILAVVCVKRLFAPYYCRKEPIIR